MRLPVLLLCGALAVPAFAGPAHADPICVHVDESSAAGFGSTDQCANTPASVTCVGQGVTTDPAHVGVGVCAPLPART